MTRPSSVNQAYIFEQQQILQNPSPPEFYMQDPGSDFVLQGCWQMKEPHGNQQHPTLYFVHTGSSKLQQHISAVGPMGQPVMGSRGYYNPSQRMTRPVQVCSLEVAAPLSNIVTIIEEGSYPTEPQRTRIKIPAFEKGSDPTQPQRTRVKIPAPVSKVPWEPIAIDKRIVYKPTAPVPVADTKPYSYQNFVYEPSPRQIYYMQVPPAMNPQYQLMSLDL